MTLAATLHAAHGTPAYLLALALTLVLASALTPRRWWHHPTARGAAVLGAGTWAFGALLLAALPLPPVVAAPVRAAVVDAPRTLAAEQPYRVHRDLNVRAQPGVGAPRVTVIAAGAIVTPTGERDGDWWRIRYGAAPQRLGWASSLWLRQATEP